MNLPDQRQRRPSPEALTRQEVADELGQSYERVYYWTARGEGTRRARSVVQPSYGEPTRKGDPAWFSPKDVEKLRRLFAAIARVRELTGRGS